MYKEYDQPTLKRLQGIELSILKDFIYICDKYHLTWFSFAGTAIGALRHQGFIPWDDDIDVCLPRRDYQKFLKAAKKEFSDKYTIMNADEDENYPLTTTRWMLKGTEFREESFKDIECELGIFLDIYAFDNVADEEWKYKLQAFEAWFWSKILILRCMPEPVIAGKGPKVEVEKLICKAAHAMLCKLGFSKRKIYLLCKRAMTRYNKKETKRISYLCDTNRYWNTIALDDLYPIRQEPFEDVMMNFPNHVEKLVEQMHPNFMELPPVEKRKNHYPYRLDMADYGLEDIDE